MELARANSTCRKMSAFVGIVADRALPHVSFSRRVVSRKYLRDDIADHQIDQELCVDEQRKLERSAQRVLNESVKVTFELLGSTLANKSKPCIQREMRSRKQTALQSAS